MKIVSSLDSSGLINGGRERARANRLVGKQLLTALVIAGCGILISACVNESSTSALTSSDIQAKESSHEQRYVAGKCNASARLISSNRASEILTAKYSAYSKNEASMAPDRKQSVLENLQAQGTQLQVLDKELNAECVNYSTCEFQASTNKQSCSRQERSFAKVEKNMRKLSKKIERIAVN